MKRPIVANLYNPHEQTKEQLIASFVVRGSVFQTLFQAIQSIRKDQPKESYLIEGQRGMGKTTLLLRLCYEIENDPALRRWLVPIVLKEEAYYGIRRLCVLWETLAQELEEKDKAFAGLSQRMLTAHEEHADEEPACFGMLMEALEQHGKTLMLFIDNLGEMLLNFTEQENRRFHDVLQRSPYIHLVGATPVVLNALLPISHVFVDFFTIIRLEGLDQEATRRVLVELARVYKQERTMKSILRNHPGRVEALRLLTGGVIRSAVLLFEVLIEQETGSSVTDLDSILDRVTPLYQSRMKDLTPLQREVVHAIALNWDAISPDEISHKTRLHPDEVHAVLRELEHVFIVQAIGDDPEQPLFQLQERFFNIWYLMRLAPGTNRSKVLWLLHFLETWYDREELTQRARQHADAVSRGRYSTKEAYYLTEAFANTGQLDMETEHYLLSETRKILEQLDTTLVEELSVSDKELFVTAQQQYQRGEYEQAVVNLLAMKHKSDQVYFQIGDAFEQCGNAKDAVEYLTKASELGHVEACARLGLLHQNAFQQHQQAATCFRQAADQGHLDAMLYLGKLSASELCEYEEAEGLYRQVMKEAQARTTVLTSGKFSLKALRNYLVTSIKGESSDTEKYHFKNFTGTKEQYVQMLEKTHAEAAFQLGNLCADHLEQPEQAEQYYRLASDAGHMSAMLYLGFLYHYQRHEPQKAIAAYKKAIEQGERRHAAANLAVLYQNDLQDAAQAETYYLMAIEQGDASAMNGLAWLYFEQKQKPQEALDYAWKAFEQGQNMYTAHTLACIYLWNDRLEQAVNVAREFMYNEQAYETLEQDILLYLMLLIAKRQYETLDDYFDAPELRLEERFKPLWYALLYFIEDPRYQRCPPELSEPVQAMIRRIQQLAQEYA